MCLGILSLVFNAILYTFLNKPLPIFTVVIIYGSNKLIKKHIVCMKILKYITPFIWLFPFCIYLAFKTSGGSYIAYGLAPQRSVLFVSIGFTMLIVDLFAKYLIGKQKLGFVWLVELIILGILIAMIYPQYYEVTH